MSDVNSSYKLTTKNYLWFLLAAGLSLVVWWKFTYPQLTFIDLSVDRYQALKIAQQYLSEERKVDLQEYHHAVIFSDDSGADQYLQKSLGFQKAVDFLKENNLELFFWRIRFFRENEKEQYYVEVSAATGEVTALSTSNTKSV